MNTRTHVTQDAAVRLMLKYPYWSELYYTMTVFEDRSLPTLATDGRNMWVNPEFWATLELDLKISALAHEIGHKMLLHCSRRGARHPMLWNIAADYVVNAILKQNGFKLGKDWLYNAQYEGWAVEAVYHDLEQKAQKLPPPPVNYGQGGTPQKGAGNGEESQQEGTQKGQSGAGDGDQDDSGSGESGASGTGKSDESEHGEAQGGAGDAGAGGQQDRHSVTYSVPGVSKEWEEKWQDIRDMQGGKEEIDKAEKEVMESVEKALMTARAHGNAPGGMEKFEDLMKPSKEPWYNHLHRYMQSLSMAEYNWARINRRHLVQHQMFTPANYSEALEHVVFAIDCSGSVFDAASQANFAGHVNAILAETKPNKTHVIYFDSRVTKHDELDYGQLEFSTRPKGGGGTDFRPIFRFMEDEGIVPEILVVLTDCYGDFPAEEPQYPVIWASIIAPEQLGHYHPPFGEIIHVED